MSEERISKALAALDHPRQLDEDGIIVGVSREALDVLRAALAEKEKEAQGLREKIKELRLLLGNEQEIGIGFKRMLATEKQLAEDACKQAEAAEREVQTLREERDQWKAKFQHAEKCYGQAIHFIDELKAKAHDLDAE